MEGPRDSAVIGSKADSSAKVLPVAYRVKRGRRVKFQLRVNGRGGRRSPYGVWARAGVRAQAGSQEEVPPGGVPPPVHVPLPVHARVPLTPERDPPPPPE